MGVRLTRLNAGTLTEIEAAFATISGQRIGAVFMGNGGVFLTYRSELAALAARYSVPVVYEYRENVDAGGLISYATDISGAWHLAGTYAGRILKGDKPADLPIQRSTKVELTINLKTAKALGLTIPETLLATADEVIE
jgi:putative ABC transport system substrate-binding protein